MAALRKYARCSEKSPLNKRDVSNASFDEVLYGALYETLYGRFLWRRN
jgi:hypothetical protein